jgi:hypothetical protein
MLLTKPPASRACAACPEAYCYLCPNKPALVGYKHRLYLEHDLIERFRHDFATAKLMGDLEHCDIDKIAYGDYAFLLLTSLEKYHRSYLEALFPYCRDFELNEPVIR